MSLLIHEVAKLSGVSIDTVRRWERLGRIASVRDVNNWRRFSPHVVEALRAAYLRQERTAAGGK